MKSIAWLAVLLLGAAAAPARAEDAARDVHDWEAFARDDVVRIRTEDADGDRRDTRVWIVALDGRGYVRTDDSRWLANIRRGSPVAVRAEEGAWVAVFAREVDDAGLAARVEEAFLAKYGFLQRVMSTFRLAQPTVLELTRP